MYPRLVPKSSPKCFQIVQKWTPKSIQNGLWEHLGPTWLPRVIFHRFWEPVLELEMLPKSIPKSRHFQVSPRNSFYAMGAPKTLQNNLQNGLQNQPFSQEDQILKILLSPRRGPSFRGLDPFKSPLFSNPFYNLSKTRLSNALLSIFHQNGTPKGTPNRTKIFTKTRAKNNIDFGTIF